MPKSQSNSVRASIEVKRNTFLGEDLSLENTTAKDLEIKSLKDIIAALNQKIKKTTDIEGELKNLRHCMGEMDEGRKILRDEIEQQH